MRSHTEFLDTLRVDLDRAQSISNIGFILRELPERLGVKHVLYHYSGAPGHLLNEPLTLMTYPRAWADNYYAKNYFSIDPVVTAAAYAKLPVDWASFKQRSPKVRSLFGEAREYGIGFNGVTLPLREAEGEPALFCFTSDALNGDWLALKTAVLPTVQVAANLIHERVLELSRPSLHAPAPSLTPRELDCLKYLASGMRDRQIADVLGLTSRVVTGYLESARYKLGASTRPNAIARAIKFQIISPDIA